TVAFTMNVTTHKYAGPYELWWRQFSPDGTIHPPARSSDADLTASVSCRHPVKGGMTQNLVGQLRRRLMLSRHVRTRIGDGLRRLTDPTPSIRVPHPTRRPTRVGKSLALQPIRKKTCLQHHPIGSLALP
ncbi:hypothetical protein TcCL_NonESM10046, partial [Trypanosoma cruzi]